MVKRIYNKVKKVLFADPKLLFDEERTLISEPFYFKGNNGKAVLLIHGWTSTAYEVRRLGKFLNDNDYTVYGPMLRGHGTSHKDLEDVRAHDWLVDIGVAFDKLKSEHEKVYIGGTSIGSNLAIAFSAGRIDVAGLILMATPYRMKLETMTVGLAKFLNIFMTYKNKFYPPTFGLSTTITRLISYQTYPIVSALEAFKIVRESRRALGEITQPCLMMQSTHDHVVAKDSLEKIYTNIRSEIKKKKYVHQAYHTFVSDIKNEHVFEDILDFLNQN